MMLMTQTKFRPINSTATLFTIIVVRIARLTALHDGWTTYGDIADAYEAFTGQKTSPRAVARALSAAQDAVEDDTPKGETTAHWIVPWHRIRYEDGTYIGKPKGESGTIADAGHWCNELLRTEMGASVMIGNAARNGRRLPMAAIVRRYKSAAA